MKNLFFRSLLLLSCLVAVQNLNAQLNAIVQEHPNGCSASFSMQIDRSSIGNQECLTITINPYGINPGDMILITDGTRNEVCLTNTCVIDWCYDRSPTAYSLWIGCSVHKNGGEGAMFCSDGCIVIIDPN